MPSDFKSSPLLVFKQALNHQLMKKYLFAVLFYVTTISLHAQLAYVEGFYLNKEGQKINCLIKNLDWDNNPDQIQIKINQKDPAQTLTLEAFQAFEIPNVVRYEVHQVQIDRSSDNIEKLDRDGLITWEDETLALRVVVRGEASLLAYKAPEIMRFFYRLENEKVEPLMFKKYLGTTRKARNIGYNRGYQSQLRENLNCGTQKWDIDYREKVLAKYFKNYNDCQGIASQVFMVRLENTLKIGLAASLFNYDFGIESNRSITQFDFDSRQDFIFGLTTAYLLPVNNNQWELLLEGYYRRHQNSGPSNRNDSRVAELNYNGIEVHLGARRFFRVKEKLRLFVEGAYAISFNESDAITLDLDGQQRISYRKRGNLLKFGTGIQFGRQHLALQYYYPIDLAKFNSFYSSKLNRYGIQYRCDLLTLKNAFKL